MFLSLIFEYVEELNRGETLVIENCFDKVVHSESKLYCEKLFE